MSSESMSSFNPDYAIHPGEILEETLEARSIKKTELAERCGISFKNLSQIIHGKAPVLPALAIKLERAVGVSASLWTNLNTQYELFQARLADQEALKQQKEWVKGFQIKQLVDWNVLPQRRLLSETLSDLLSFFRVGNIEAWHEHYMTQNVAYRRSPTFKSNPKSVATWLRLGEVFAERIECKAYDKKEFKSALFKIREVMNEPIEVFQEVMVELCANVGVAVVFVPELPKTHVSGATKWLTRDKAMIILSLRHKKEDHFWFSFFHEAAHILFHGKTEVFIENQEEEKDSKELEADKVASNFLIPKKFYRVFVSAGDFKKDTIVAFAKKMKIPPGVVVGRLQHDEYIPYHYHNKLIRKFTFKAL